MTPDVGGAQCWFWSKFTNYHPLLSEGRDSNPIKDLLATLSSNNQGKVQKLKDNISRLKIKNKKASLEGTQLEPVDTLVIEKLDKTP